MIKEPNKRFENGYVLATYTYPRLLARKFAESYYREFPKQGYMTHVHSWYETQQGHICFTMARLSSCD